MATRTFEITDEEIGDKKKIGWPPWFVHYE